MDFLLELVTLFIAVVCFPLIVFSPLFIFMDMMAMEDVLYFKRHKLVKKRMKKEGYKQLDLFLCSLFGTNSKDWKLEGDGVVYHPFEKQPNIFLTLRRRRYSDVCLVLHYKDRELFSLKYDAEKKQIKDICTESKHLAIEEIDSFNPKARHLFEHLLPIMNMHKRPQEVPREKTDVLSEEMIYEKKKALRTFLESFSSDGKQEINNFSMHVTSYNQTHFATLYMDNQPFVIAIYENEECTLEYLNQSSPFFTIFEQELPFIQKSCADYFRLDGKRSYSVFKWTSSPLVRSKSKEIEAMLEKLKGEEAWLQEEDYHRIIHTYPSDVSIIIDTYTKLDSPKDTEEKVLNSLQNIYHRLSELMTKAEENKNKLLEKQYRLTQIR